MCHNNHCPSRVYLSLTHCSVGVLGVLVLRAGVLSPPHSLDFQSRSEWHEDGKSGRDPCIPVAFWHKGVSSIWVLPRLPTCISSLGGRGGVEGGKSSSPQSWEARGTTTIALVPCFILGLSHELSRQ